MLVDQETGIVLPEEASFSDPRRFGSVVLCSTKQKFDELAPDAPMEMNGENLEGIIDKVTGRARSIKPILLDQKYANSGAGNWICGEELYQTNILTDQKYLTEDQAKLLLETLARILKTAVEADPYKLPLEWLPKEWLINCRWERVPKTAGNTRLNMFSRVARSPPSYLSFKRKLMDHRQSMT